MGLLVVLRPPLQHGVPEHVPPHDLRGQDARLPEAEATAAGHGRGRRGQGEGSEEGADAGGFSDVTGGVSDGRPGAYPVQLEEEVEEGGRRVLRVPARRVQIHGANGVGRVPREQEGG